MPIPLEPRKVYNFNVYPSLLLGSDFSGSTVLSILHHSDAIRETDIFAQHAQIYPFLPAGTPNDATGYDYVKLELPSGNKIILGIPWIDANSIVLISSQRVNVSLTGIVPTDVAKIKALFAANNIKYNSITTTTI